VAALFAWRLNVNHRWHPLALLGAWKRRRAPQLQAQAALAKAEAE